MKTTLLCLMLAMPLLAFAQPPDTVWTKEYSGTPFGEFDDVKQALDGGFICVGVASSNAGDMWVVRTNGYGDTLWTRVFGGAGWDRAYAVSLTSDSGFVVAGFTWSFGAGNADLWLIRLDSMGDTLWTRTYGGSVSDAALAMTATNDGGFALAGFTHGWEEDIWLIKTDANGDTTWARSYGGSGQDVAYAIQQTDDGGLIVAGYTQSFGAGGEDVWLLKTNAYGDSIWSRTFGGAGDEEGRSVVQTSDEGYIIAGWTGSFGEGWENAWLIKTDSSGNAQWNHAYGNAEIVWATTVIQETNGEYLIAGSYSAAVETSDAWFAGISSTGDTLWTWRYTQGGITTVNGSSRCVDGGFIFAGIAHGYDSDGLIIRTGQDSLSVDHSADPMPSAISITCFPNPFNSETTLQIELPAHHSEVSLMVYNIAGQMMLGQRVVADGPQLKYHLNGSELASGIYFAHVEASNLQVTQKLVLLK